MHTCDVFFFFSSRRRHTRFDCDWSSDVCSSDLSSRPRAEWNWVEGADERIKWADLPAFFSQFDAGPTVGGEDGFLLLPHSSKNQKIINDLVTHSPEVRDP